MHAEANLLEQRLQSLQIYRNKDFEIHEIINNVFDYIVDKDNAYGFVVEWSLDFADRYAGIYPQTELETLKNLFIDFGANATDKLVQLGTYDKSGVFWYQFDHFIGYDVVMKKVNPGDYEIRE